MGLQILAPRNENNEKASHRPVNSLKPRNMNKIVTSTIETIFKVTQDPEKYWNEKLEEIIDEPCSYISRKYQGKQFRTILLHTFNLAYFHLDDSIISMLAKVAERLHNASLVIDDIEDDSKVRRGLKTSHLVYGIAGSLNSANYSYFLALQELINFENQCENPNSDRLNRVTQIFNKELINLHRGQGLDIYWRDYRDKSDISSIPSEEEYISMVRNKTGGLFRLMINLMNCYGEHTEKPSPQSFAKITQLCDLLGVIYQIRDDYLNLVPGSDVSQTKNTFAEDITEGKFSFPLVHGIQKELVEFDNKSEIYDILLLKTSNEEYKTRVLNILERYNVLETTKATIHELGNIVLKSYLDTAESSLPLRAVIQKLTDI